MRTIQTILNELSPTDRAAIMVAFEDGTGLFVQIADGQYLGVNLTRERFPNLKCVMQNGVWSVSENYSVRTPAS